MGEVEKKCRKKHLMWKCNIVILMIVFMTVFRVDTITVQQ